MGKSSQQGSGGTTTTQSNSTMAPPTWYSNAQQNLYQNSMDTADKLNPQSVAQVAPLTGGQQSGIQALWDNIGNQDNNYATAQGTLNGLQGFNAPSITAGQLSNTDLSPYLNPFTQDVINSTNAIGKQALGQAISGTGATAAQSGAFGGSRQGVQEGVANSQYALGAANTNAQLQQANFNQAQGAASSDIGTRLAADTTNAGNAINSAGLRLNAANSGVSAANSQQSTYLNGLMAALTGQGMIQGQQQGQNQYAADVANAQNQLGTQRLGLQSGTLNGFSNVGGTTEGTQTAQSAQPSSTFGQILGGGLGVLGAVAPALGPMGFGITGASGLLNGLIKK